MFESDDDGTVATEPMTDDEDQEEESGVEEWQDNQDYDNTTANDTKRHASTKEIEDTFSRVRFLKTRLNEKP